MVLGKKFPFMTLALGICCGAACSLPAQAQQPPAAAKVAVADHDGLPNFDIRLTADGLPVPSVLNALAKRTKTPGRQAAFQRLLGRVPFLTIDDDSILGTPRFVRSWAQPLTNENPGLAPSTIVRNFIADNATLFEIDSAEIVAARVTRNYTDDHNGVTHLTFQQQIGGIDLFDAGIKANTDRDGRLINISSTMLPRPAGDFQAPAAALSDLEAIRAAAASVGVEVCTDPTPAEAAQGPSLKRRWNNSEDFRSDQAIVTERVIFPMTRDDLRPAWYVVIPTRGVGHTYEIVLDAIDGTVLHRADELCFDVGSVTMRVYTGRSATPGPANSTNYRYPFASRSLVTVNPSDPTVALPSPFGWLDTNGAPGADFTDTRGNNVDAHLDRNADNIADTPRPDGGASAIFDFPQDNSADPTAWGSAAVVQAFYYTNTYHDRLYALGFTEAAGNFQTNNYGRGGTAGDAVQMDCQDGSGTNNANFSTPADGQAGRCQMYVWTTATPSRDGDLDAEVLFHELTHGLSNRLTGGPANSGALGATQSGGMGEGWSDFVSCCLLTSVGEDPNGYYCTGAYSTNNYFSGVRRFPYITNMAVNPLTWDAYGATGTGGGVMRSTEVHNTGEIWCMTLWECRAGLYAIYGYAANNLILRLVIDGMKLQPALPSFSQARDAILAADMADNGGINQLILWKAFAKRGLGFSFSTPDANSTATPTLGFDVPPFAESGDAGELPATAATLLGSGSISKITGTLTLNDADMYRISICDRTTFSASTVGQATFNTQLFLFDLSGNPVTFNDDDSASGTFQSTITGQFVPANGDYYLAISASDRDPVSSTGEMWADAPTTTERQPDGPGAGHPITGWTGVGDPGASGAYAIALTGACASSVGAVAPEPKALTAFGAPTPTPLYFTDTALKSLTVYVLPGTLPASTGVTVSLNASSIGLGTIPLLNNGGALGSPGVNSVFSAQRSLASLAVGDYFLPYTVSDAQGRVFNDIMTLTVTDPIVSCCLPTTACAVQARSACIAQAGTVLGASIPCAIHPCVSRHEIEPNNTIAQANNASQSFSIYSGNLYHMGITGTISSTTDADYFNIGALQVGDVITVSESGAPSSTGTLPDPTVRLYRNGTTAVVIEDDDGGPGIDSLIWRFPITVTDTYFVRGYRFDSTSTGTYRLGISLENSGPVPNTGGTFTAEVEPNESKGAANDASSSWRKVQYISTTSGTISSSTDLDTYAFQFTAGDVVSVNIFSTSSLDAKLNLFNSAGTLLTLENGGSTGPLGDSPLFGYVIPSTGTYYVQAGSTSLGTTGTYLMAVYLSSNTPPTLACLADFNADGARTVTDIFAFLSAWFAGDPRADVDGNGSVSVADIFLFLSHWFSGC